MGFPSHALIACPHGADRCGIAGFSPLIKGIRDQGELERALGRCAKASSEGLVQLETDMRAHGNPTRLRVLRTLAFRLVRRIASPCPACGAPTPRIRAEVWGCVVCAHRRVKSRLDGRRSADPGDCSRCNP